MVYSDDSLDGDGRNSDEYYRAGSLDPLRVLILKAEHGSV